jgi:hypothetical protein
MRMYSSSRGLPAAGAISYPPDDPWYTANLLATLGPTFEFAPSLDVVVSLTAGPFVGLTVLLQNACAERLGIEVRLMDADHSSALDWIRVGLAPLEVGALVMPCAVPPDREIKVSFAYWAKPRSPRVRQEPTQSYDVLRTLGGVAMGLVTAALTPVGHFSTTRRGGRITGPLSGRLRSARPGGRIEYGRIWAPPGSPETTAEIHRRQDAGGYAITSAGEWAIGCGASLAAMLLALPAVVISMEAPAGVFVLSAPVLAVVLFWRLKRGHGPESLTRRKQSLLVDALGDGVVDRTSN